MRGVPHRQQCGYECSYLLGPEEHPALLQGLRRCLGSASLNQSPGELAGAVGNVSRRRDDLHDRQAVALGDVDVVLAVGSEVHDAGTLLGRDEVPGPHGVALLARFDEVEGRHVASLPIRSCPVMCVEDLHPLPKHFFDELPGQDQLLARGIRDRQPPRTRCRARRRPPCSPAASRESSSTRAREVSGSSTSGKRTKTEGSTTVW